VARLLSLERLAPELKDSGRARLLALGAALVVLAMAFGGLLLGLYLKDSRAGTTQVLFHSTEPFGSGPGARLVYVPERGTLVMRGWLMQPMNGSGVYQVWAVEAGAYRSLGMADAVDYVGFTLVAERDLTGVQRIVITVEPPGGSLASPQGPIIVEMVPGI